MGNGRLVDIRLEREMEMDSQEILRDVRVISDICTRCGPTSRRPSSVERIAPRNRSKITTSGRRLSYYAMISQETLSVEVFDMRGRINLTLGQTFSGLVPSIALRARTD